MVSSLEDYVKLQESCKAGKVKVDGVPVWKLYLARSLAWTFITLCLLLFFVIYKVMFS